jgi:hypothetical protein
MASPLHAVLGALVATAFWTVLGYALARPTLPRALASGMAPVIGWAVFSAATLPALTAIGFSRTAVVGLAAFALIAAGLSLVVRRVPAEAEPGVPWPSFGAAGVLALVPASAILPKFSAGGVHLADPIFDHAKIAIVDAMTRQGLPPINPVVAEGGRLAYYYLWHFSAAELALPLRITGWEADIAATWFTAFASLAAMMGVAVWLGKKPNAAYVVVALAAAASLRTVLGLMLGTQGLEPFLAASSGFAGWLFQSAWVPQHLMSASCVVTVVVLLVQYAERQSAEWLLLLALIVAAGFESSAFVGGVTFAVAALAATPLLFAGIHRAKRLRFAAGLGAAAVLTLVLVAPFIRDQLTTVAQRGGGSPIAVAPFEVLGTWFAPGLRRWLDLPAYWLILLPLEFPAAFIAGVVALVVLWRGSAVGPERTTIAVLAVLAGAGLVISWLLTDTLGENNDLALRAVLPACMVLIAAAGAGAMAAHWRIAIAAVAGAGLLLSLPNAVEMIGSNAIGTATPDDAIFAQSPDLWAAVRRYAAPTARVANNPLYLQDLTPWPVNPSWALLADRSSCFAGREMALAFASLSAERREAINAQFIRVFGGQGTQADVDAMAKDYGCDVIVVVPQDGAWRSDPFASNPDYRLAEFQDGKWRIYVRASAQP